MASHHHYQEVATCTPAIVIELFASILAGADMLIGRKIGSVWGSRVEVPGGIVLVGIGLKILFFSRKRSPLACLARFSASPYTSAVQVSE